MNREEIKRLLPHREPMLLVDEAELRGDTAYGKYTVTGDEWFLKGHFPGDPIVPGVVLCEMMAQACGLLLGELLIGKTPFYTGIDKVRFKKQVRPGDCVETTARIERSKGAFYFTHCEAFAGGELCARGDLSFALVNNQG